MPKMNLLFYYSNSPYEELKWAKGKTGGAEISLRLIAEKFAGRGHKAIFFSSTRSRQIGYHSVHINGVRVIHLAAARWPRNMALKLKSKLINFQNKSFLKHLVKRQKIDIVYLFNTQNDLKNIVPTRKDGGFKIVQRMAGLDWYVEVERGHEAKEIEGLLNHVDKRNYITPGLFGLIEEKAREIGIRLSKKPSFTADIGTLWIKQEPWASPKRSNRIVSVAKRMLNSSNSSRMKNCPGVRLNEF